MITDTDPNNPGWPPQGHAGNDPDDDEAFFRDRRALMSARSQRVIEALERVKAVYVECGRDKVLKSSFEAFLENYFATRGGRREEADVFFLTGESGAGKSEAVGRLLRNLPVLKPQQRSYGYITPYVSIKLTGFTHPRIAGRRIIEAAGYSLRADTQRGEIWHTMASHLRTHRVFLVHIDETQHLIKQNASQREREDLANAIKGVSIDQKWPVAFLLSGLPRVADLPLHDEQFERRGSFIHFPDVALPAERKLVERIIRKLSQAAELEFKGLITTDLPERIAHAARYRYARICQIVLHAIHQALRDPGEVESVLGRHHFAMAYAEHSHARGHNDRNVFLVDDWERLAPGSFIFDEDEYSGDH